MPDDPSVAARPAPFWKIALGATSVALVAGLWTVVAELFYHPDPESGHWSILVVPLLMLLAGGLFFGHYSRRRLWLVSLFLIVPNPMLLIVLANWMESLGASPGSTGEYSGSDLIALGALVAAPLIGVGLAFALTRFRR